MQILEGKPLSCAGICVGKASVKWYFEELVKMSETDGLRDLPLVASQPQLDNNST
jgi:hypothetical protein